MFSMAYISLYAVLVLLIFLLQEWLEKRLSTMRIIDLVEVFMLGGFLFEIILYTFTYRRLYWEDRWNIIDLIVIVFSIIFTSVDLASSTPIVILDFIAMRGIFRLLRFVVLYRKLQHLRTLNQLKAFGTNFDG
jgi:hypothetical protein